MILLFHFTYYIVYVHIIKLHKFLEIYTFFFINSPSSNMILIINNYYNIYSISLPNCNLIKVAMLQNN